MMLISSVTFHQHVIKVVIEIDSLDKGIPVGLQKCGYGKAQSEITACSPSISTFRMVLVRFL